jgi:translation initiation factor 2 beta subunit (eIF-2beta)/eIF-5
MKKLFSLITVIFAIFMLTGCGHRHNVEEWSADYIAHWHVCTECGEKTDYTGHEFGKDDVCIVCN